MSATQTPIMPTPDLSRRAEAVLRELRSEGRFALVDRTTGNDIELPGEVYAMLRKVLTALARNQAVSVLPTDLELTTNEAADFLNVSRGYVIKLLDSGQLGHRLVGTHRRVRLEEVLAFRERMQRTATEALDELVEIDETLGLAD